MHSLQLRLFLSINDCKQSVMFVLFSYFSFGQNDTCEMNDISAPFKLFVGLLLWNFLFNGVFLEHVIFTNHWMIFWDRFLRHRKFREYMVGRHLDHLEVILSIHQIISGKTSSRSWILLWIVYAEIMYVQCSFLDESYCFL